MKRAARGNCGEETYGQSCGQEENLPHVFWSASGVLTLVSSTPFASSHGGNNGSPCLGAPFPGADEFGQVSPGSQISHIG